MDEKQQPQTTDNGELQAAVVRLFHSHFAEVLDIISSRFPHTRGDHSTNEAEFNGLRAKILRSGNNKLRMLPEILGDYQAKKVRDTVKETLVIVQTPVALPEDARKTKDEEKAQ